MDGKQDCVQHAFQIDLGIIIINYTIEHDWERLHSCYVGVMNVLCLKGFTYGIDHKKIATEQYLCTMIPHVW